MRDSKDDDEMSFQDKSGGAGQVVTVHVRHFCRSVSKKGIDRIPDVFEVLRGLDNCGRV